MEDYYKVFIDSYELTLGQMIQDFDFEINEARNKKMVFNELMVQANQNLTARYEKLGSYSGFFFEIQDELDRHINKNFKDTFNSKIDSLPEGAANKIMTDLVMLYSSINFKNFVYSKFAELYPKVEENHSKNSSIKWLGNKTEFIGLVYALHEAKYISGDGITKIVNELAEILNFPLGDENQWFPLHDKSIKNFNNGYNPPVINCLNKLLSAYLQLREKKASQ